MGESFPPEVVAKLNDKWLPDKAGTSCLLLLNCLTQINTYWIALTDDEDEWDMYDRRDKYDGDATDARDDTGPCPEPEPDPIRDHQLEIGKLEWLRIRLSELLKQLDHSDKWGSFLKDIDALEYSQMPSIPATGVQSPIHKQVQKLFDGLSRELLRYGQENELPIGWETNGWYDTFLGIHPVRNIPELIHHLKQRSEYVSYDEKTPSGKLPFRFAAWTMGYLNDRVADPFWLTKPERWLNCDEALQKHLLAVLETTFRNARLAIPALIGDPERWPILENDPDNFRKSRVQLDVLIARLSVIAAQQERAEPPMTVNPLPGGDEVGRRRMSLRKCDITAGSQYMQAIKLCPELKTDRDAYDWCVEHLAEQDELPKFETWTKYLRRFRAESGSQKNQRGVGHETRSVVSGDKLEQQNRTEADF